MIGRAGLVRQLRARVDRGFLYANSHYAGHAAETVRRLMEIAGASATMAAHGW